MANNAAKKLVIVSNVLTPYRVHLHKRIAAEIAGIELHTVLTHAKADFNWSLEVPEQIRSVNFANGNERAEEPMWRRPISEYRKAGRVIRFLENLQPDAVILNGYADAGRLRLLGHLHSAGVPTFLRGDSNILGDQAAGPKLAVKRRVMSWAIGRSAGVMVMGQLGLEYFVNYGADPAKCYEAPYEPDVSALRSRTGVEAGVGEGAQPRFPLDRRYILFAGRLVKAKRLDLLVDVFATIADKRPDWDLLVAGDGPLSTELQTRVPNHLSNRVHWLGFTEAESMREVFQRSEVMVLPSDLEPWGVVIEEAIASGLVVIASDAVGAAREIGIGNLQGALLFRAGSRVDLEEKLLAGTAFADDRGVLDQLKTVYLNWKADHDPVAGIKRALSDAKIVSPS